SQMLANEAIRRFSTRLGSEAIRVGQALGYQLEEILHLPPETIARAGEGDAGAMRACDEQRLKDSKATSSEQRPPMGQDMLKGRRTEIEFLNGYVVREASPADGRIGKMNGQHERGTISHLRKELTARARGLLLVGVEDCRPVRFAALQGVMHQVAGNHGVLSARADVDAAMVR